MLKKFKKDFICKFQRPLSVINSSMNLILVYNEDRSIEQQFEMTGDEIESIFPNKEFKTYWRCRIKNKMLEPLEQVEEQVW